MARLFDGGEKKKGTAENPRKIGGFGVPGAVRTPGLPLRRRPLYPAELRRHGSMGYPVNYAKMKKAKTNGQPGKVEKTDKRTSSLTKRSTI